MFATAADLQWAFILTMLAIVGGMVWAWLLIAAEVKEARSKWR